MVYATIAEVRGLLARAVETNDFGSNNPMTEAEATAIISDVGDEIDTCLSAQGLTVPVSSPTHFVNALGLLNAYGACARILKSILPDVTGPGETPAYAYWESLYTKGKKAIEDGSGIPAGAVTPGGSVAGAAASHLTDHPDENPDLGANANPEITRGKVF
jgi:hypothetical protein